MSSGTDDPRRPDDRHEELERLLRDGDAERPAPPAGLLDRLLDDLPERLDVAPEILAETEDRDADPIAERSTGARPRRRWLAAATVILALGAGAVALQLIRETPSPTSPTSSTSSRLAERQEATGEAEAEARPEGRDRESDAAFEDRAELEERAGLEENLAGDAGTAAPESMQDSVPDPVQDSVPDPVPSAALEPVPEPPAVTAPEPVPEPAPEAPARTGESDEADGLRAEMAREPTRNRSAGAEPRLEKVVEIAEVEGIEEPSASEPTIDAPLSIAADAGAVAPGVALRLDRLAAATEAEAAWAALGERLEAGLLPAPGSPAARELIAAVLGGNAEGEDLVLAAAPLPEELWSLLVPEGPGAAGGSGEIVLLALALGDPSASRSLVLDPAGVEAGRRLAAGSGLFLLRPVPSAGKNTPLARAETATGEVRTLTRGAVAPRFDDADPALRLAVVAAAAARRLDPTGGAGARGAIVRDDNVRGDNARGDTENAARAADLARLASRARAVAAELEAAGSPGADRARELDRRLERAAALLEPDAGR